MASQTPIIIGTRGSKLALWQANHVKALLEEAHPHLSFEISTITTKGDKILDVALSKIGDKGLFTKEIEECLFAGTIHLAVHSLKDLPTVMPAGTKIGAILERGECRDALVSPKGLTIEQLTEDHTIATSSLRRKAQILSINPRAKVIDIRGNVDTRLRKMHEGYCDAMMMAGAGLKRLGYNSEITNLMNPQAFIPAPGQGAIAIEIRDNDPMIEELISPLHCKITGQMIDAERAFLNELEGGCQIPIGSHAVVNQHSLTHYGMVANEDGTKIIRDSITGDATTADQLGRELAQCIKRQGGDQLLKNS